MKEIKTSAPQNIILENRKQLRISGVKDIDSFSESKVVLNTIQGELVIKGDDLHVIALETSTGEFSMNGTIKSLCYNSFKSDSSFFSRLFR